MLASHGALAPLAGTHAHLFASLPIFVPAASIRAMEQVVGRENNVLEDNLRKDQEIAELQRENFRKAHEAGVRMVYGTDTGVHPHGDNGKQFRVMVQYGMQPFEAIRAATINATEALGRDDVGGWQGWA